MHLSRAFIDTQEYTLVVVGNLAALNKWDFMAPAIGPARMEQVDNGVWQSGEIEVAEGEQGGVLEYKY